jgi:glucose-6-phosphate isomerase
MENLKINVDKIYDFVKKEIVHDFASDIKKYNKALHEKTGKGSDFLGWVNLPSSINERIFAKNVK